jgi:hypothetical protein
MKSLQGYALLAILLLALACKQPAAVKTGAAIPVEDKQTITALTQKIHAALQHKDIAYLQSIVSDSLKKIAPIGFFDTIISHTLLDNENKTIKVLDEYLINNTSSNHINTVSSDKGNSSDYTLTFPITTTDTYIQLCEVQGSGVGNSFMMSCLFVKQSGSWKLETFNLRSYTFLGKSTAELFGIARKKFYDSNLLAAQFYTVLASETAEAGGKFFHYKNEDTMKNFADSLQKTLFQNVHLPVKMDMIPSKPKIVGITAKQVKTGIYPLIIYKTGNDVTDSIRLFSENDLVHQNINNVLKGMTDIADTLIYIAIDDAPTIKNIPKRMEFVKRSKN